MLYQGNELDLSVNKSICRVMYKTPPKEHQFKKGKSGNPSGRPKKADARNIELLERLLQTFVLALKNDEIAKDKMKKIEDTLKEKI